MTAQVYQNLLDQIQRCELMPGAELNEKLIIEQTGFGRTPVREALLALQRDGLVEIFPRKGMRVTPFTEEFVTELYQVRKLLEPAVVMAYTPMYPKSRLLSFARQFERDDLADKAAHYRADISFHSFLVSVTDNKMLIEIHDQLMTHLFRLAMYAVATGTSHPENNNPEHKTIIDALLKENETEAKDALIFHINQSLITSLRSVNNDTRGEPRLR